MAQGDWKTFQALSEEIADGTHDLDTTVFAVALLSNSYASIAASAAAHSLTDFTQVSGGTYAAKPLISPVWTRTGATTKLDAADFTGGNEWARDASSGPTDIRSAILYNTGNNVGMGVVDLTSDGTTPVSMQAGPISMAFNASGILSVTVSV